MTLRLNDQAAQQLRVLVPDLQACYQCGECTAVCPWSPRVEGFSPRRVLRRLQLGAGFDDPNLWRCTACAACTTVCPRGIDPPQLVRAARHEALRRQNVPEGVQRALEGLADRGNAYGVAASKRSAWAQGLGLQDHGQFPVLLFVGCLSSFDPRAAKGARALARALQVAKVKFGTLGNSEVCCGNDVLGMGETGLFEELARQNIRAIEASAASTVVTFSPHCYNALKHEYPRLGLDGVEVLHYTEYLARLAEERRLWPPGQLGLKVAYHDPCFLGRVNRVFEEPRTVLGAAGARLVELEENRDGSLCCGGGSGGSFQEVPADERFANARVLQAVDAGAEVLATACPVCVQMFEDAVAANGLTKKLQVSDTSALVGRVMEVHK